MATLVTYELPWVEVVLASTHFYFSEEDAESCLVQWHAAGATLYILLKDKLEIDLRMEREIVDVKYQNPNEIAGMAKTAVISMTMLPSRPLAWATGTDFDPLWDDCNKISIKIMLGTASDTKTYGHLVQWMTQNVNSGEAKMLTMKEASTYWKGLHSLDISSEGEEDGPGLSGGMKKEVLSGTFGILRARDLERLKPGQWANDEVMNYGFSVIAAQAKRHEMQKPFHIMSTFFHQQLQQYGPNGVAKWKKKNSLLDLFDYDYVVIPVNSVRLCPHWYLIIIDMPANALRLKKGTNTQQDESPVKGGIYILDSLSSGHPASATTKLLEYIATEAARKKGRRVDLDNYPLFNVKVPQQLNGYDCGYYALHFAKVFVEDPDKYRALIWSKTATHLKRNWGEPSSMRGSLESHLQKEITEKVNSVEAPEQTGQNTADASVGQSKEGDHDMEGAEGVEEDQAVAGRGQLQEGDYDMADGEAVAGDGATTDD